MPRVECHLVRHVPRCLQTLGHLIWLGDIDHAEVGGANQLRLDPCRREKINLDG
jgi:hypothetical protein